jgi:hypothetical protein
MWLFLGMWDQIQEATVAIQREAPDDALNQPLLNLQSSPINPDSNALKSRQLQFLFYLKNWMSF